MGGGNQTYDYGFRIYNPSLGKFLSVDPLSGKFAYYSPYQYAGNTPIVAIDLDGLEDMWVHTWVYEDGTKGSMILFPTTEDGQPDPMFEYSLNEYCKKMGLDRNMVPTTGVFETAEFINNSGESQFDASSRFVDNNDLAVVKDHAFGRFGRWVAKQKDKLNNWLNSFSSQENGYEMQGEEGLKEYSSDLNNTGVALELTGVFAPVGATMSGMSSLIDSGLDLKNLPLEDAIQNITIRALLFWGSKKMEDKFLNLNGGREAPILDQLFKGSIETVNYSLEESLLIKDEPIKDEPKNN
jgi:uncharacterized protein RhaS with RHS repeats